MDIFIQITVVCPPEYRVGAFVYRTAGKVYCVGHVDASVVRCICITISLQPRLFRLLFYLTSFNQHVVKREMRYPLFCYLIAIKC